MCICLIINPTRCTVAEEDLAVNIYKVAINLERSANRLDIQWPETILFGQLRQEDVNLYGVTPLVVYALGLPDSEELFKFVILEKRRC